VRHELRQGKVYCNATLRCVRATTLSVENAISVPCSECVFVALGIQHGGPLLSCVACVAVPCFPTFSHNNIIIIYLLTAIGLLPGGSGYFTCKQNMKLVTTRFKSGGLHKKHVVATCNVGNRLSICL